MMNKSRRKILGNLACLSLLYPLTACGKGNLFMKKEVVLDVVLFSYLKITIFDVHLNGGDIGVAGPYGGGGGVMTGVTIPLGTQTLNWRDAGSGKSFSVKNLLTLPPEAIQSNANYLAVHIYPDSTAELMTSENLPQPSIRGEQIYKENHLYGR